MTLRTVADIRLIELPSNRCDDGELVVTEVGKTLPFAAKRMFTVYANANAVRGRHAHKQCNQFLVCIHGKIAVECDDGASKAKYLLDTGRQGLLIPASIWATQTYQSDGSILAVLCDHGFDEGDYLRDYDKYLAWRRGTR